MTTHYTETVEHNVHLAEGRMKFAASDVEFEIGVLRDIASGMDYPQRVVAVAERLESVLESLRKGGVKL